MKVSIIIAVYKDIEALELIFETLSYQTYKNFEVIVAEDGHSMQMQGCIKNAKKKYGFELKHTTQEDKGVRKSKSQNNGIRASAGEYLIFIDGDCLLYSNFIENHILLSGDKKIVTGRRVNLGLKYSKILRERKITAKYLENNFLKEFFRIKEDAKAERHSEEGFKIKFNGIVHKFLRLRRKKMALLGCNMSMYKNVMLEINGFDEDLGNSAFAGDADLEWRFKGIGCQIISGRFLINQFHLYHKRSEAEFNRKIDEVIKQNQQKKRYRCENGLDKV